MGVRMAQRPASSRSRPSLGRTFHTKGGLSCSKGGVRNSWNSTSRAADNRDSQQEGQDLTWSSSGKQQTCHSSCLSQGAPVRVGLLSCDVWLTRTDHHPRSGTYRPLICRSERRKSADKKPDMGCGSFPRGLSDSLKWHFHHHQLLLLSHLPQRLCFSRMRNLSCVPLPWASAHMNWHFLHTEYTEPAVSTDTACSSCHAWPRCIASSHCPTVS